MLPFFHKGMSDVLPRGELVPGVGHQVTLMVGEPLDLASLLKECRAKAGASKPKQEKLHRVYAQIMKRVEDSLKDLEAKCEKVHAGDKA